ncbi:FAD-binding domain-containing protein [Xylaria sp. CBS 124048]|nr:FAD-binding domain-containing protein [Xylaria sp. CBS 124048]
MTRTLFAICYLALYWARQGTALLSHDLLDVVSTYHGPSTLADQITKSSAEIDDTARNATSPYGFAATQRAAAVCAISKVIFHGDVYTNSNTQYTTSEDINWSQTCWLPAACFIRPQSTIEVAVALKLITVTGSKFAIRSGGHNPNPGYGSIDGEGVLIDLQDMKLLSIDSNGTVSSGPGHRWADLYEFSQDHNRTIKGGRTTDVGLPGFYLGGGMPFFSSLNGLAVDSVLNYEIVLANSTVVNANRDENPELFRALKGGGPNFGIITRFDIATYPVIRANYAVNLYNSSDYLNILNATAKVLSSMDSDPNVDFYVSVTPTVVSIGMFYADWLAEPPAAFAPFNELESFVGPMVPLENGTVASLGADLAANTPVYNARRVTSAISTKLDPELYIQHHEQFLKTVDAAGLEFAANLSYTIQPLSSAAVKAGNSLGGNALGLEEITQIWWATVVEWTDEEKDSQALQTIKTLSDDLSSLAEGRDDLLQYEFMNDANFMQTVLDSYGRDNLALFRSVAVEYDPFAVFQNLQNDGFLLRKIKS